MVTLVYAENDGVVHEQDTARLPELMADASRTFWLDLEAPSDQEFSLLRDVFQFHPLAIEDARRPHQRPKLGEYESHLFITADEVTLDPDAYSAAQTKGSAGAIQSRQVSAFL